MVGKGPGSPRMNVQPLTGKCGHCTGHIVLVRHRWLGGHALVRLIVANQAFHILQVRRTFSSKRQMGFRRRRHSIARPTTWTVSNPCPIHHGNLNVHTTNHRNSSRIPPRPVTSRCVNCMNRSDAPRQSTRAAHEPPVEASPNARPALVPEAATAAEIT